MILFETIGVLRREWETMHITVLPPGPHGFVAAALHVIRAHNDRKHAGILDGVPDLCAVLVAGHHHVGHALPQPPEIREPMRVCQSMHKAL